MEVHEDARAFDRLAPEWRALSAMAGNACPFLGVEWHRTWWTIYARPADRLHLVAFRLEDELVGLLPLYARRRGGLGPARLRFVGTGEPRGEEVVTEYADALARDDAAEAVGDAALAHLARFARWRSVELRCLLEGSVLLDAIEGGDPERVLVRGAGFRYRVDLADGETAHLARLGPARARRIARSRRAAALDGGFERVAAPVTPDEIDAALGTLADLHERRQRSLGRRHGAFAAARFARFHATLVHALSPAGGADVRTWRIGGEPVAALHLYAGGATLHYYQSGFAQAGANRWMPLTLAHLDRMAEARAAGVRWYDLMRGEPPCYKDDFGCETTPMRDALLFASGTGLRLEAWRLALRARAGRALGRLGLRD